MLRQTLARTLWNVYDALGALIVANLLWFALTLPFLLMVALVSLPLIQAEPVVLIAVAFPTLFLNPASLALAEMAQRLAETGDAELSSFKHGFRSHFFRATLLLIFGVLGTMALCASFLFYARGVLDLLGSFGNMLGAGLTVWAAAFVAATSCYWAPVAVGVEGSAPRVWFTVKRSALLTLDSPLFTLGVALTTALSTAFWLTTVIGLPVIGMSFLRTFHAQARRTLREKQAAADNVIGRCEPPTRRNVRAELRRMWEKQSKRSVGELVKPWGE